MIRIALGAAVVAALLAASTAAAGGSETPPVDAGIHSVVHTGSPVPAAVVPVNGRIMGTGWDLEVSGLFTGPSPDRYAYTEVRLAVVVRNTSGQPIPFSSAAFRDDAGYPQLALRDASGSSHPYRIRRPQYEAVPASTLIDIPPGMTARWTIGFQVPTVDADPLRLVVTDPASGDTTEVDLTTAQDPATWPPPPQATSLNLGEELAWGDLNVTPLGFGTRVCGDPTFEHVVQVVAVAVEVVNTASVDRVWPGTRFPEVPAVASWQDGASARFIRDTFVGTDPGLHRWADDAVVIPPRGVVASRALVFAVPRDGRMGTVSSSPRGIYLTPPDSSPAWLALEGDGSLELGPAYCDTGLFDFAIPYAFAPGESYLVGPAGVRVDPASADIEARQTLTSALVVLGGYAQAQGSYLGVDATLLEAIWGGVDFTNGFTAGGVGFVGVEADGSQAAVISTRSASGTWFCVRDDLESESTSFGDATDLSELQSVCLDVASNDGA